MNKMIIEFFDERIINFKKEGPLDKRELREKVMKTIGETLGITELKEINYKLVDLIKFICAFLVIGIHTRQFLSVSDIADRLFYYDVSNYSVPFFYACSGYFLLAKKSNIKLGDRLKIRIKKVLRLYLVWSLLYIPLTLYGWCIEGNWKLSYLFRCLRNFFCWGKLLFVDAMVSEWFDFCFACDKTDAEKILNW